MTPKEAFEFAKKWGASNEIRKIVCQDSECAYLYALDIDKEFHEDIWEATKNTEYEEKYKNFFNQI